MSESNVEQLKLNLVQAESEDHWNFFEILLGRIFHSLAPTRIVAVYSGEIPVPPVLEAGIAIESNPAGERSYLIIPPSGTQAHLGQMILEAAHALGDYKSLDIETLQIVKKPPERKPNACQSFKIYTAGHTKSEELGICKLIVWEGEARHHRPDQVFAADPVVSTEALTLELGLGAIQLGLEDFFALRTGRALTFKTPPRLAAELRLGGRVWAQGELEFEGDEARFEISALPAHPKRKRSNFLPKNAITE